MCETIIAYFMQFSSWEPLYREILKDLGFSGKADEEAAQLLHDLLRPAKSSWIKLEEAFNIVHRASIIICGNSPTLSSELEGLICSSSIEEVVFIAADGATSVLLKAGIVPDIIVTDLDGNMEDILKASEIGSIVFVHAHGDNLDKLLEFVPQFKIAIGTTQSRPPEGLYNFGGFTDGDRCVFLARHLGASKIELIGFDFEDQTVTPRKRKKLAWARRLIDIALFNLPPITKQ